MKIPCGVVHVSSRRILHQLFSLSSPTDIVAYFFFCVNFVIFLFIFCHNPFVKLIFLYFNLYFSFIITKKYCFIAHYAYYACLNIFIYRLYTKNPCRFSTRTFKELI